MGLLDKIFRNKNEITMPDVELRTLDSKNPIMVTKEINSIIEILGNLGLMDSKQIEKKLEANRIDDSIDISVLKRLDIHTNPENISRLKKYFTSVPIGYGSVKLNQLRDKLKDLSDEWIEEGKNQPEVVEEMISYVKMEIDLYEKTIRTFNKTIIKIEENDLSESEKIAMIDFWTNYYKENELGYPIDLNNKVNTMARELRQLPYGGYGTDEVNRFLEACNKMIEEGRINKEETNHTLSRITTSLFEPKKSRYISDVETLKRKLQMINESPYLKEEEKEKNRNRTIQEFQVMNGHMLDLNSIINQMKADLSILEYGGLGPSLQQEFVEKVEIIITRGKIQGKSDDELKQKIEEVFNQMKDDYYQKVEKMKNEIYQISMEENKSVEQKEEEKEELIEEFHIEMGHEIDYKEKINSMLENLQNLENGGYGDQKMEEFKQFAIDKMKSAATNKEKRNSLKEIREKYEKWIKYYEDKLKTYKKKKAEIEDNNSISIEEKNTEVNELLRIFKLDMGYQMNFTKIINTYLEELKSIGYGQSVLDSFKEECEEIASQQLEDTLKYNQIKNKYKVLKEWNEKKRVIFQEWKSLRLKNVRFNDRDKEEKILDEEIKKMLSLSPNELYEYYLEDAKKKKNITEEVYGERILSMENSLLRQMLYVEAKLAKKENER